MPNHRACDIIEDILLKMHSKNNFNEYSLYQITDKSTSFHTTYDQVRNKSKHKLTL